jgi:TRAP-type C4-dicarboxylate transport system substrate-binding protein
MKISRVLLSLGSALLIAATAGQASAKEFNISIWFPDAHPLTNHGYIQWAKSLEKASGGALTPKVFTGTVLLPPAAHLSGLRDGIAQVTYHAGTYTPADLPEDNLLAQMAFSYSDYFLAVFATTDMNLNDPEMQAMWKRNGVVYGGGYATPPYRLFCTTKVTTLEEIKGKRLRMPGAAHSDWAKSVGAVPVNVSSSEMYNGLDKGQLDCASNAANDMKSRSLWDVAKHTTMIELGVYWAGYEYAFNPDFWKGLTPGERRIMFDTMAEAMVKTGHGYMKQSDEAVAEAPQHGVTVYEPSAELKKSVTDFSAVAKTKAIELGKSKFKLKDPEGLIGRFEKVIAKWQKLLANVDRGDEAALIAVLRKEVYDKIDVATYGTD